MHYALQRVDRLFAGDTYDAVIAFQKVNGLARTGRVDAALWRRILHARTPQPRYRGNHVEVDKTRQVLFEVRGGHVVLVVPVSTGATGNTPLGIWHVYRRVAGFDWVLYYPTYFLRGFAIHGYPSVPAFPASHGCVRVPMWVATRLYSMHPYGFTVYVYY
jgi:lipoprotein-anchoring transpeptidase ErfK/SrfK